MSVRAEHKYICVEYHNLIDSRWPGLAGGPGCLVSRGNEVPVDAKGPKKVPSTLYVMFAGLKLRMKCLGRSEIISKEQTILLRKMKGQDGRYDAIIFGADSRGVNRSPVATWLHPPGLVKLLWQGGATIAIAPLAG